MRIITLLFLIIGSSIKLIGQDQIIVNDSTKIECRIIYISANQIQYENYRTLTIEIVNADTIKGYKYRCNTFINSSKQNKLLFKPYSYHIAKNTFYVELIGNTTGYSVNFDRIIYQKNKLKNSLRIGGALFRKYSVLFPSFITESIFFTGANKHHFEFGAGLTYLEFATDSQTNEFNHSQVLFVNGRIGYRYKKPDGGFFFNIGFIPMIPAYIFKDTNDEYNKFSFDGILPMGGLGFGYTLKGKTATNIK